MRKIVYSINYAVMGMFSRPSFVGCGELANHILRDLYCVTVRLGTASGGIRIVDVKSAAQQCVSHDCSFIYWS